MPTPPERSGGCGGHGGNDIIASLLRQNEQLMAQIRGGEQGSAREGPRQTAEDWAPPEWGDEERRQAVLLGSRREAMRSVAYQCKVQGAAPQALAWRVGGMVDLMMDNRTDFYSAVLRQRFEVLLPQLRHIKQHLESGEEVPEGLREMFSNTLREHSDRR